MAPQDDRDLPEEQRGFSRRDLLQAGLFATAAGVLTAAGISATNRSVTGVTDAAIRSDAAIPLHSGVTGAVGGRGPAHALVPTGRPPAPTGLTRLHTWADPISRLDTATGRRLGLRFPKRAVMLTIDDGPHPVWTPKYLRLLAKHDVRATFNVIGGQVHANASLLRATVNEGHVVGNHTFHHPLNLPYLSAHRIRSELVDTTDAIVRATGFRPRQFRAAGGVWGPDVFAEVARQQMEPLGWDIDPRDWALPGVTEIRRAMEAARPHDIILCHDGGGNRSETYRALETVIPALLARDFEFVTLPAGH